MCSAIDMVSELTDADHGPGMLAAPPPPGELAPL
jgi:hypothetical protein